MVYNSYYIVSLSVQGLIDSIVGYLTVIDRDNLYGLIV